MLLARKITSAAVVLRTKGLSEAAALGGDVFDARTPAGRRPTPRTPC